VAPELARGSTRGNVVGDCSQAMFAVVQGKIGLQREFLSLPARRAGCRSRIIWRVAVQQQHRMVLLGAAALGLMAAACTTAKTFRVDDVPDALRAPANELLTQQAHAKGVQIYECKPSKEDATRFEWVFVAPQASLFDSTGKKIAVHYAGPSWEGVDGSLVVGQVAARANSPDGHSIPWLLLTAKPTSGNGQFGGVTSIQRLHTAGGAAPSSCNGKQSGKQLRVGYTADYYFYVGPR
jgi:hypothetical protein